MLDAYRKSRREAEKEKYTNEKRAAAKPANENCTNDLISSESKTSPSSHTSPPTSRGEFERPASGLSKDPSPQNFTNELAPAPAKPMVRRKEPLPAHLRS
ncbi:MAG: hypothetical protein AAFY56_12015 [Pseudomonadota bacterium]